jgi:hypothetical protein
VISKYDRVDQRLHELSQILAKFNRTYLKSRDNDSHTNLGYGTINQRLFSRWSETTSSRHILSLELNPLSFVLLDKAYRRELEVLVLGKTNKQIEAELKHKLSQIGIQTKRFSDPMHYEIPEYETLGMPHDNLTPQEFQEWTDLRALGNTACHQIQAHFQVQDEVRIWPHHFDTGIFVSLNKSLSIGFGLAMSDKWSETAYFYYTALYKGKTHWPDNHPMKLKTGRIIESSEWCGAVLEAPNLSPGKLLDFMREASAYYLGFL